MGKGYTIAESTTFTGEITIDSPPLHPLPKKAHKLALRLLQLAKESGEYEFTLIVGDDGRWKLRPPAKVEDLGR